MKKPWFDDDEEVAKLTGVNRSTGELVPFSYEPPNRAVCVAAAVLAIAGAMYLIWRY
jgi:hypothetical protein